MQEIYAIRGAITVDRDFPKDMEEAVKLLMDTLMRENELTDSDLCSIIFSQTQDLKTANAAAACRKAGYAHSVPLFCVQEAYVAGGLERCVRVLVTVNHKMEKEARMIYLKGASGLRPDLSK